MFRNKLSRLRSFLQLVNNNDSMQAGSWIAMAIGVMLSVLMLPPVTETVLGVNTTNWTFTGAAAAKTLMYLIPMVYIAGVLVKIIKTVLGK